MNSDQHIIFSEAAEPIDLRFFQQALIAIELGASDDKVLSYLNFLSGVLPFRQLHFLHVLPHFDMLNTKFKVTQPKKSCVFISESKWIRANFSGMFKASVKINAHVKKGDTIGNLTDPYGSFNHFVKAPNDGYIFNINHSPLVYQGDAIFHISTALKND